jgi:hypothetical protein
MLNPWECFSYFLMLPPSARTEYWCFIMTRNTPEILPYCQHCGKFKGVGICTNPKCDKTKQVELGALEDLSSECAICSVEGEHRCSRCERSYCNQHASGREESELTSMDQHLGTCIVCGNVICEQCWLLNSRGLVTCLVHHESKEFE